MREKSFEREEGLAVFVRLREEGFAGSVRVSVRECMHEGLGKKKREDIRAREK